MADVRDVVADALREIGVLAAGEVASAEDSLSGLSALNRLVDQWASERLQIYSVTRTAWSLVSGTAAYTVGLGGTVNIPRPVFVQSVHVRDTAATIPTEEPLICLTDDAYALLPSKTQTATDPIYYYHNPTYPLATLTLWPVPTSATLQGVIYAPAAVAEFTDLNTLLALPPGYRRMLVKNLALEMAPSYTRPVTPVLAEHAIDSKAAVKRMNHRTADLSIESGALVQGGPAYDIRFG